MASGDVRMGLFDDTGGLEGALSGLSVVALRHVDVFVHVVAH